MKVKQMGKRHFSDEFKARAVEMVLGEGFTVPRACQALGIGETALRRWVQQRQSPRLPAADSPVLDVEAVRQENEQLKKRVAQLEQEQTLLKKSTAYFVRELERSWK